MKKTIMIGILAAMIAPAASQAQVSSQVGSVVNDICMAPKTLLMEDPYSPFAVRCLTSAEVNAAKAALRKRAAETPRICNFSTIKMAYDPYSPLMVTCKSDAEIGTQVSSYQATLTPAQKQKMCAGVVDYLTTDAFGPKAAACVKPGVMNAVGTYQKNITQHQLGIIKNATSLNKLLRDVSIPYTTPK